MLAVSISIIDTDFIANETTADGISPLSGAAVYYAEKWPASLNDSFVLERVSFIDNVGGAGGWTTGNNKQPATSCLRGPVDLISDSLFTNNSGGSTVTLDTTGAAQVISGCTFTSNLGGDSTATAGGIAAGEFASNVELEVYNSSFTGNRGGETGGIHLRFGTLLVEDCVFTGNNAAPFGIGSGGAIHASSAFIDRCVFRSNTATAKGGAVYLNLADSFISNSLFVGNIAGDHGGAIAFEYSSYYPMQITITNCTVTQNESAGFGAIWVDAPQGFRLRNSILWNNSKLNATSHILDHEFFRSEIRTGFDDVDFNLIEDAGTFGGSNMITGAPDFVDPSGTDGFSTDNDFWLDTTSPAIDTGSSTALGLDVNGDFVVDITLTADLLGSARERAARTLSTAITDLGCYERCMPEHNNDGFLDTGDISGSVPPGFVTDFLAGNIRADYNGDGILDTGDINLFSSLFILGCN